MRAWPACKPARTRKHGHEVEGGNVADAAQQASGDGHEAVAQGCGVHAPQHLRQPRFVQPHPHPHPVHDHLRQAAV